MRAESLPPPQPPVQIKLLYKKLHVEVQCTCSTPVHEIAPDTGVNAPGFSKLATGDQNFSLPCTSAHLHIYPTFKMTCAIFSNKHLKVNWDKFSHLISSSIQSNKF